MATFWLRLLKKMNGIKILFFPLSFFVGSGIRDPGWEKIRIGSG